MGKFQKSSAPSFYSFSTKRFSKNPLAQSAQKNAYRKFEISFKKD